MPRRWSARAKKYGEGSAVIENDAFGAGWNGDINHAPSQNAVYDKLTAMISDTAYGAAWNGVTDISPSKNAVYDKIETITGGSASDTDAKILAWLGI